MNDANQSAYTLSGEMLNVLLISMKEAGGDTLYNTLLPQTPWRRYLGNPPPNTADLITIGDEQAQFHLVAQRMMTPDLYRAWGAISAERVKVKLMATPLPFMFDGQLGDLQGVARLLAAGQIYAAAGRQMGWPIEAEAGDSSVQLVYAGCQECLYSRSDEPVCYCVLASCWANVSAFAHLDLQAQEVSCHAVDPGVSACRIALTLATSREADL